MCVRAAPGNQIMSKKVKTTRKERKRTRTSAAETRQKIVDAALAIVAEKGFDQATTAEIARHAGVAEGSIYNYFRTKDELLLHMVTEYAGSFRVELSEAIAAERSALRKIERLISFHIQFFTKEGDIFQVIFGKAPGTKVQWARIIRVAVGPYVSLIEEIICEGVAEGTFKAVHPQVAASVLLGAMQLTILRRFFDLADYGPEEAAEQIKKICLEGLVVKR